MCPKILLLIIIIKYYYHTSYCRSNQRVLMWKVCSALMHSPSRPQQSTVHWLNRLIKDFQHLAAHVERSQLPQEIESAHPFLIHSVSVGLPIQSTSSLRIRSGCENVLFLLKLITISHHSEADDFYQSTLYSSSLPSLIQYIQPLQSHQITSASGLTRSCTERGVQCEEEE